MKSPWRGLVPGVLLLVAPVSAHADPETEAEQAWSVTVISDFKIITDRHADDDVGSFFDQYEFTPNKSSSLPTELGIRDLSYDRFGPDLTPQVQLRFGSPTSNLGISGSQVDRSFLNQRADLIARHEGLGMDFRYWRQRTEDLRLFPNTLGRQFQDLTEASDRFDRERTGLFADLRLRPAALGTGAAAATSWLSPELSLRAGFEDREGSEQLRFLQDGSNRWGQLDQPRDQETTKAGGGLLVAPGGLFTLTVDADYHRFRHDSPTIVERDLGAGFRAEDDSVGFVPDSDRLTGTVLVQSRIAERAVLEGGFQVSHLEQVDDLTPTQRAAGLDDNELLFYSANVGADVDVTDSISVNGFFKYDRRENDIPRNTQLFNPVDDGVQFDPFPKRWDRVYAGVEAVYALHSRNLVAIGARYEWVDRDLDFGAPTNLTILEPNARVADRTRLWTVYGRTNLRPLRGLGLSAEIGYQGAPDTGYTLDLDKYVYGKLNVSYRIPIERMVLLSTFVRGGSGENDDFALTSGLGATAARTPVKYESKEVTWGATVTSYPLDDVSVFASFFHSYHKQNYELVLSDLQRYFQGVVPIGFSEGGSPDPEIDQMSFVLGTHVRFSDETDGSLSYSFTRAQLDYESSGETVNVRRIAANRSIDADIHGVRVEVGHWLRDGLRVQAGYRLQLFDDAESRPNGTGSAARSLDPSTAQHTVTLGVTLTSDLVARSE